MKPITTQFIEKAKAIHGDMYDYNNVDYKGRNIPVEIICKNHGSFFQKPTYHIQRKSGCLQCYREKQQYTEDYFLQQAKDKFGSKFKYGKYNGYRSNIEIECPSHGKFITTPSNHLIGDGSCPSCRSEKISLNINEWIERFVQQHGDIYDYSKNNKIRSDEKMVVVCSKHGEFYPTPNNHIRGHGCPICANMKYVGGYSEEFFEKYPERKNELSTLYTIRLYDENEQFYKVGITVRSVETRFKSTLPYDYEVINEEHLTLYEAHLKEQDILRNTKRYIPTKHFSGWTECYK